MPVVGLMFYDTSIAGSVNSQLDSLTETLQDEETWEIDFFTLAVRDTGIGSYDIEATLDFDTPDIDDAAASGSGGWLNVSTFVGSFSSGILMWDETTIPDIYTLPDGNVISVAFESGIAIGYGESAVVHAYITNHGQAAAPVPEPATMLLMGTGLVCIAGASKKKFLKRHR